MRTVTPENETAGQAAVARVPLPDVFEGSTSQDAVDLRQDPGRIATRGSGLGAEEAALWQALRDRADPSARKRLMALHLPYARIVAASYYARRTHNEVEFDEYLQLASLGLVECVDRFDPSKGVQFRTFAARRMHGAILNGLECLTEKNQQIAARKRVQLERLEAVKLAAASQRDDGTSGKDELLRYLAEVGVGIAIGILLEGTGMVDNESFGNVAVSASPEVSYFRRSEIQRLQQLVGDRLKELNAQEQTVMRHHYLQGVPFDQIAEQMNLSKGRISQIHRGALKRLRDMFVAAGDCDLAL